MSEENKQDGLKKRFLDSVIYWELGSDRLLDQVLWH